MAACLTGTYNWKLQKNQDINFDDKVLIISHLRNGHNSDVIASLIQYIVSRFFKVYQPLNIFPAYLYVRTQDFIFGMMHVDPDDERN